DEFGMRGQLCYEITDRNREGEGAEGIEENRRFALSVMKHPLLKAALGAHASFTITDKTLDDMAALQDSMDLPLHIHLLEDKADEVVSIDKFDMSPEARLTLRGFFRPGAIIVHGVHLSDTKLKRIQESGATMVNNPRSNMNNRVGRAPSGHGSWALGTDGIDSDILAEARTAFFRGREDNPPVDWMGPMHMLKNAQNLLGRPFGLDLGTLSEGGAADITVLDYHAPTPLNGDNFSGHLYFGLGSYACESTMVKGRWVMKNRSLVGVDEERLLALSREGAKKLYKKMEEIQ
ncbi:amidohydrolase family protein, partial [Myxococcota bacterium]|nr:amidohydrolase family protein [Myxococcota bacterium]